MPSGLAGTQEIPGLKLETRGVRKLQSHNTNHIEDPKYITRAPKSYLRLPPLGMANYIKRKPIIEAPTFAHHLCLGPINHFLVDHFLSTPEIPSGPSKNLTDLVLSKVTNGGHSPTMLTPDE